MSPLDTTYTSLCFQEDWAPPPPPKDAGADARADAGGGLDDAGLDDAGAAPDDAGAPDAGPPRLPPRQVQQCDDFEVALYGKQRKDVWVTRLRAVLPNQALETTLVLEPSASQTPVSNIHAAKTAGAITARIAAWGPDRLYGAYTTAALTAFVVSRLLRRRRRR